MNYRVFSVAALLVFVLAAPIWAAFPVYNNTPNSISVCVATYRGASEILSSDGSSSYATPARIMVNGWYKIDPYGAFVNVPHGTHILILGPGNKRQTKEPKNTQGFPIKKNWQVVTINQTFKRDPYANTWAGLNAFVASDPTLENRLFVPISYFRDSQGSIRITHERLGW